MYQPFLFALAEVDASACSLLSFRLSESIGLSVALRTRTRLSVLRCDDSAPGSAFFRSTKSSSPKTLNPLLAARKQATNTTNSTGIRRRGTRRNGPDRIMSTTRRGSAVSRVRARAFDRPCPTGACSTRRRENHARSIIATASRALPMAPAVVPRMLAPRPTVTRSIIVAVTLTPRTCRVLLTDWRAVIKRKLCAEKIRVAAIIAKGTA